MISEEIFVGLISVALGLFCLGVAAFNWDYYYQLRKVQWLESRWGRTVVRLFYAMLGTALVGLGVLIAAGFGPNTTRAQIGLEVRS